MAFRIPRIHPEKVGGKKRGFCPASPGADFHNRIPVFARFGREMETLPAIFSDLTGKAVWGLLFLIGRRNRRGAALAIRLHFRLLLLIEVLNLAAEAIFDVGKLFFPVSTVQAVDCTQDIFMLLGVIVFSKYLPGFLREDIRHTTLWQKIVGILVMVFGGILIAIGSG